MKPIKKNIHFSGEQLEEIDSLSRLLQFGDIKGHYGAIPKTLKFSVTFTKLMLENMYKATPPLNMDNYVIFLETMKKLREVDLSPKPGANDQNSPIK